MAAVAREADVAAGAPHLSTKKLSRPFGDDPGEITTRRARQGRALHDSCDILHVTRINASRIYLNDNFAALWMRPSDFLNLQLARQPEAVETKRAHARLSYYSGMTTPPFFGIAS